MKKVAYKIKGVTCNHCVTAVSKAVSYCSGVRGAHVSLEKAEASLRILEKEFSIEEVKNAIKNAGEYELIV